MAYVNGYGYGGTPYWQFIDANGTPLSNGKVATYIAGTTTAYNTLKDWNHTYNGVVFDLDIRGGCTMIWPTTQLIKIIVKDVDGNLFKTLDNIQASGSEGGYIPGTTVIRVDGTDNEIISTASADPEDPTKLIFTISLDPAITEAIATNASDIGGIQTHINNIDNSIITINDTLDTLQRDVDIVESDVDIVEGDVAALKLSDQYTTFKATSAAGSGGYTFKIATALKTKAPLTSTTILEYDLTNNYLGKINAAWGMRGHVVYQQIMQMDDQYTAVDYMHYTHLYEFSDRWELWGHTAAGWAGDISVRPSKNISINTTVHVNPWVFVGKAVSGSLPTVYTEHNWVDYTMPVNNSKRTSVWAEGEGTSDHKVMIDANDQGAKYLNDKILTGGILSKAIEAAGEVGDWYEVLRLTATLYTDGDTCSGTGTSSDPLVATGDHKAICSTGDVPGYLQNKLVGSDWIDATEIQLSANEKNIKFALKNPDYFVKGATIYGGTILPATTGDFNSPTHNGYYTCYYNTLNAPPVQTGNPSWFVHHMNSNAGPLYAVQIAYAYTSTIICYERTKVAGVWQDWTLRKDIIFDSIPQYGSTNAVTSNGIFNANSLIKASTDSKLNLIYAVSIGDYIYKIDAEENVRDVTTESLTRDWTGICQGADGYLYACVYGFYDAYIYKIDSTGILKAITSTLRQWYGICQGADGFLYATVDEGFIYRLDTSDIGTGNETGIETAITTTARRWSGICQGADGFLYATVDEGYIYKITTSGVETAITTTARSWSGICQGIDGYLYATAVDDYIYRINTSGLETAITSTANNWHGICQGADGFLYATVWGDCIYKITTSGVEYPIESTALGSWVGICQASSVLPQRNYGLTIVNNSTETAYTFTGRDENTCHIINTETATTRTVPNYAVAPDFSVGSSIEIINIGTGVVTFAAEDGVTLLSSLTLVMYGQYSVCMLRKIAINTWILTGERTAV